MNECTYGARGYRANRQGEADSNNTRGEPTTVGERGEGNDAPAPGRTATKITAGQDGAGPNEL